MYGLGGEIMSRVRLQEGADRERFTLSLDKDLLQEIDWMCAKFGISNRSMFIRACVRMVIEMEKCREREGNNE